MSAKFKAVSALDDRVARMSDLRVLVDEVSKLISLQQVQIDELTDSINVMRHATNRPDTALSELASPAGDRTPLSLVGEQP